jgi:hypothetical protein
VRLSMEEVKSLKRRLNNGECSAWEHTVCKENELNLIDTIEAQQQEIWQAKQERDSQQRCAIKAMTEVEELKAQAAEMSKALIELKGIFCNNTKCPYEYCKPECESYGVIKKVSEALSNDAGKDYHNPADVEALRQAREALIYCMISACRPAKGVAEVAIATIDKALGGNEDA